MRTFPRNRLNFGLTPVGSILFLGGVILLAGCSSFRTEWGRALPENADRFTEGDAKVETVVHELGPPAQVSALPGGFAFLYEHSIVSEFQWGVSLNQPILKWLKFVHGSNRLEQDILLMIFDDEGVLRSMDAEVWRGELGGGNAAQFLFTTMGLTDDSALRQDSPQHRWGRDDLERLPVLLNSGQSLRSGQYGLQLRLAPLMAGQTSLEMAEPTPLKQKRKKSQR